MQGPNQKIFLSFLVLSFLFAPSSLQAVDFQTAWVKTVFSSDTFTGKVVAVSDVNTISVIRAGRTVKVRLHGIDCPEKKQAFGTRAKRFTSHLAFGKEVTVRIQTTDRFGCIVGVVILPDGKNLNWELVDTGLAWWYRKYAPGDLILERLESWARGAKRGLWVDKNPIPPWVWRRGKGAGAKKVTIALCRGYFKNAGIHNLDYRFNHYRWNHLLRRISGQLCLPAWAV